MHECHVKSPLLAGETLEPNLGNKCQVSDQLKIQFIQRHYLFIPCLILAEISQQKLVRM